MVVEDTIKSNRAGHGVYRKVLDHNTPLARERILSYEQEQDPPTVGQIILIPRFQFNLSYLVSGTHFDIPATGRRVDIQLSDFVAFLDMIVLVIGT